MVVLIGFTIIEGWGIRELCVCVCNDTKDYGIKVKCQSIPAIVPKVGVVIGIMLRMFCVRSL